jgi:hypothetical protein
MPRAGISRSRRPNSFAGKFMRGLLSRRRKFVMAAPTARILQKVADLASERKLPILIGCVARLEESVRLIGRLEAGRRVKGKALIVLP